MLQKEFFQVQPFNPNPYWNPVIVNLSGAQKFEEDTVFVPGKYRIEVAPGISSDVIKTSASDVRSGFMFFDKTEVITEPFIVRAYCGSSALDSLVPGTNPYSGAFKVDAVDARTLSPSYRPNGIDVNHIFGAGGGNAHAEAYATIAGHNLATNAYYGGGGNCLGNGSVNYFNYAGNFGYASGAGSCLHLMPVGGVFGTNYLRAYHINGHQGFGAFGGVYGAGASPYAYVYYGAGSESHWYTRGGNSPYGTGGTAWGENGGGLGGGTFFGATVSDVGSCSCAYFNGNTWNSDGTRVNVKENGVIVPNSYIRITFLGPLD